MKYNVDVKTNFEMKYILSQCNRYAKKKEENEIDVMTIFQMK